MEIFTGRRLFAGPPDRRGREPLLSFLPGAGSHQRGRTPFRQILPPGRPWTGDKRKRLLIGRVYFLRIIGGVLAVFREMWNLLTEI